VNGGGGGKNGARLDAGLDLHAQRRREGIPTISLLAGPPGLGLAVWRAWCAARGLVTAVCDVAREDDVARALVSAASERFDLRALAAFAAAPHAQTSAEELLRRLDRAREPERDLLLARATGALAPGLAGACRLLLERPAAPEPPADGGAARALAWAINELLAEARPCLILAPRDAETSADWLHGAATAGARLLEEQPQFGLAIASAARLEDLPHSRARALAREGLLPLRYLDARAIGVHLESAGVVRRSVAPASVERLAADGADDELVALYARAARAAASAAPADDARSEAERFLFARLESLSWASGRFELNGRPGFRFGVRDAEVDLLARGPRVAVEIDGYHHFVDRDAFRRDRRKDYTLQRHGYLVLRFLEEDVVARLEDILDTIEEAVRQRSTSVGGTT
jgi:very-short-patch-repair endonuclease